LRARTWLLPGWRGKGHVFDGLTIFFDDTTVDDARRPAFRRFHRAFVMRLIQEMQAVGRPYHLNLVIPQRQLGVPDGDYEFGQLAEYIETAEPRPPAASIDASARVHYRGTSDISVYFLVPLEDPTALSKRELRRKIDETRDLAGHRRIAFLESVVPLRFEARSDKPVPMSPERERVLEDDLAYLRWNYGGAGVWPVPVAGRGQGEAVRDAFARNFVAPGTNGSICRLACPNRLALRLLLQLAALLDAALLVAYATSCRLRQAGGRRLLLGLWAMGLATLATGGVVFACDPLFDKLRTGNAPLLVLIVVLVAGFAYATFKTRTEEP
jgi:hypothetical protein